MGTSFSAPLVSGAAALMHCANAQLSPTQYLTLLQDSAAPFAIASTITTTVCHVPAGPADVQTEECICTTETCGAGMLNTQAAVIAAQNPFAIPGSEQRHAGANVTIDARSSFASNNRSIIGYQWSALAVKGATPAFADGAQALTTFQVSGSSQFMLRLTVTDDLGAQDTADIAVRTPAETPPSFEPIS